MNAIVSLIFSCFATNIFVLCISGYECDKNSKEKKLFSVNVHYPFILFEPFKPVKIDFVIIIYTVYWMLIEFLAQKTLIDHRLFLRELQCWSLENVLSLLTLANPVL